MVSRQPRLVGADESHAWISVYAGAELGWVDFDPTNDTVVGDQHVTIGWGRDYGDVCPIQGVFVADQIYRSKARTLPIFAHLRA